MLIDAINPFAYPMLHINNRLHFSANKDNILRAVCDELNKRTHQNISSLDKQNFWSLAVMAIQAGVEESLLTSSRILMLVDFAPSDGESRDDTFKKLAVRKKEVLDDITCENAILGSVMERKRTISCTLSAIINPGSSQWSQNRHAYFMIKRGWFECSSGAGQMARAIEIKSTIDSELSTYDVKHNERRRELSKKIREARKFCGHLKFSDCCGRISDKTRIHFAIRDLCPVTLDGLAREEIDCLYEKVINIVKNGGQGYPQQTYGILLRY
ncbi:MAG: hypothetical protein CMF50_06975 [Legionellales bacterium]|nr:hypothetical protein [Legionellales bacterium]